MNNQIKKTAINAVQLASKELLKRFQKFDRNTSEFKSQREVVTKADLSAEKIIIREIKKNFKDHRILSEEAGDNQKDSEYMWIIDPLDGTTNFTMHNAMWGVIVSLAQRNKQGGYDIVLGVISLPVLDELYVAEKKGGAKAFANGKIKTLKVSDFGAGQALNAFCHGYKDRDTDIAIKYLGYQKKNGFDCRQIGSSAVEFAFVASGRIDSIVIPGANSWDVAAGALLVREAGGRVSDFQGKDWILESRDIIATNGKIHKYILDIINKL